MTIVFRKDGCPLRPLVRHQQGSHTGVLIVADGFEKEVEPEMV